MRKLRAALRIFFITCEVLGRLYLVMIGIAPSTGGDAIKIVIGGLFALAVIGYVASQMGRLAHMSRLIFNSIALNPSIRWKLPNDRA